MSNVDLCSVSGSYAPD